MKPYIEFVRRQVKKRLLPRNPSGTPLAFEPIIVVRQILRILRKYPECGVHQKIAIDLSLVRRISDLRTIVSFVYGTTRQLSRNPRTLEISHSCKHLSEDLPVALACERLQREYGNSKPILDEMLIFRVLEAYVWAETHEFDLAVAAHPPEGPQDYYMRGISFCNLGYHQLAVEDFTKEIELSIKSLPSYRSRCRCLFEHLGDSAGALLDVDAEIYYRGSGTDVLSVDALLYRARILASLSRLNDAVISLQKMVNTVLQLLDVSIWDERGGAVAMGGSQYSGFWLRDLVEDALVLVQSLPTEFQGMMKPLAAIYEQF